MPEVTLKSGILPIKLNTGADKRELDRAKFLLSSLGRNWQGSTPFELHIVGLNDEIEEVKAGFEPLSARYKNLLLVYHNEAEFFSGVDEFYKVSGTYKQQFIKMFVPSRLNLGAFLTFDADVVCINHFDERTFVKNNRLVSAWEPRHIHSWWENSMSATRIWTDIRAQGLSVTPNTLHSDICVLLEKYFALRGLSAIAELQKLAIKHPHLRTYEHESGFALSWSEYSLYNIVAEWFGAIDDYHLPAAEVKDSGIHLHSIRSVWGKGNAERLTTYKDQPGHFVIVQSWSGIPIEEVSRRLEIPLD